MSILTLKEVKDALKVSDSTMRRILKSGQLSAAKIGNQWRISEGDLNTYFKSRSIITRKKNS